MSQLNKVKLLITEDGFKVLSVDGHIINKVTHVEASYDLVPGESDGSHHRVTIMLDAEFVVEDQRKNIKIDPKVAKEIIVNAYNQGSMIEVKLRYPTPDEEFDVWTIYRVTNPSPFDWDHCIYTWRRKGQDPLTV